MHLKLNEYFGGDIKVRFAGPNQPYFEIRGERHMLTNSDIVEMHKLLGEFIEAYSDAEFSEQFVNELPADALQPWEPFEL